MGIIKKKKKKKKFCKGCNLYMYINETTIVKITT